MPSGAKKRKAAKKKLQKQAHNNGAHPQGSDDPKTHDDRESDGGEVEREASEEVAGNNVTEIGKEVKSEKFDDVNVEADDTSRDSSEEHKSSSSSSSEDDEVEVEKEKPVVEEFGEVEQRGESSVPEGAIPDESVKPADYVPEVTSGDNSVTSDVVDNSIEESIPVEESVKEVVDGLSGNSSEPADITAKDNESLLPQSSGVTTMNRNGGYDHVKESEKHKYSEEQPLVSSAPLPVRRTSWMNCCGLFEVLSGGSGR